MTNAIKLQGFGKFVSIVSLFLILIGVYNLLSLNWLNRLQDQSIKADTSKVRIINGLIHNLQIERGLSSAKLSIKSDIAKLAHERAIVNTNDVLIEAIDYFDARNKATIQSKLSLIRVSSDITNIFYGYSHLIDYISLQVSSFHLNHPESKVKIKTNLLFVLGQYKEILGRIRAKRFECGFEANEKLTESVSSVFKFLFKRKRDLEKQLMSLADQTTMHKVITDINKTSFGQLLQNDINDFCIASQRVNSQIWWHEATKIIERLNNYWLNEYNSVELMLVENEETNFAKLTIYIASIIIISSIFLWLLSSHSKFPNSLSIQKPLLIKIIGLLFIFTHYFFIKQIVNTNKLENDYSEQRTHFEQSYHNIQFLVHRELPWLILNTLNTKPNIDSLTFKTDSNFLELKEEILNISRLIGASLSVVVESDKGVKALLQEGKDFSTLFKSNEIQITSDELMFGGTALFLSSAISKDGISIYRYRLYLDESHRQFIDIFLE